MAIRLGPGAIKGLGIPALRQVLAGDVDADGPGSRSLDLPFSEIDVKAALERGILSVEDGRMSTGSVANGEADATIEGTVDLLLWIVDLALAKTGKTDGASEIDTARQHLYRVVGRPDRPTGFSSPEN